MKFKTIHSSYGCIAIVASLSLMPMNGKSATKGSTEIFPPLVTQSQTVIRGTVVDQNGPIIGATVREQGTKNGTVTDLDGNFTLQLSSPQAVLEISYIGYKTQLIHCNGQKTLHVNLVENNAQLSEVVVVGYGTQKRVDLTGSVSSINMEDLAESRPITNVSQALSGLAAGVTVTSSSNRPGSDNASIRVRGQGTLNSSSPLVIIDGVEQSISSVNPQDIESISILKDAASSAIYGSRAANGVILITTKKGKTGKINVDYNGYVSFESIRKTLTPVSDYADYMKIINEGLSNSKMATVFSQNAIDTWHNNHDDLLYPNQDWIDATFKNSVSTNHVISMSGGSEKVHFYTSAGYLDNPGVMYNSGFKKYNGRINLDADVAKWLNIGLRVSGYVSDTQPGAQEIDNVFTYASATTPGMVFRAPDGRFGAMNNTEDDSQCANNNPLKRAYQWDGRNRSNDFRTRVFATLKPFKGFSLTGSYSYEFYDHDVSRKPVFLEGWNFLTNQVTYTNKGKSSIYNSDSKTERYFNDLIARYDIKVLQKKLDINAMAGVSNELYRSYGFSATKYDLVDMSMDVINGASGEANANGSRSEWAMRSFFGRLNLNWDEKYLFEFNLRADGSSRFAKKKRWGYFPSASFGWRIDQEKFMAHALNNQLSNLKLRLSYGELGNNSVGNYDSQALYTTNNGNNNYVFNNTMATGLAQVAIANPNLTWEKTKVFDVGFDFGFFNNRFTGTVDYFNKRTTDILINLPAPAVHGTASLPKVNSATVTNNGLELTLGWQDDINAFHYGINGNFTYVKNVVNKFKGRDAGGMSISGANLIWENHSINSQYLLRVDRILQTDDDMKLVQEMIDNAPTDSNGKKVNPFAAFGTPEKGDLLYKDVNGDGIIDNNDKEIVSDGPNPKYLLGLNLNASWKGIDFSMLLQGAFGVKVYWQQAAYNTPTVRYGYELNKEIVDGRWYERRTDAKYPRLLHYSDARNTQMSDFYLQNKAYLKIRNIQIGYSLPKSWTSKIYMERLRFYCSLENFFTLTNYKGFDPEVNGVDYPSIRQAVIGINITF